jgi:hypothetical protein
VRFVITPTDETFRKVDKLISKDMREAMRLLGTDNGILDLRTPNIDLESDDFSALDRERPNYNRFSWPKYRALWGGMPGYNTVPNHGDSE